MNHRTWKTLARRSAALLSTVVALAACAAEDIEDVESSEAAQTGSCAVSRADGGGFQWFNYRAQDLGCGFGQDGPYIGGQYLNGFLMKGRILCAYRWLERNDRAIFDGLGRPSGNEVHYTDPHASGIEWVKREAWYSPFETGGKIQFQWNADACGGLNGQHGYLKVFAKKKAYSCEATCQANGGPNGAYYVSGTSSADCADATRNAKAAIPRGQYPRHCSCSDTAGFRGTGTQCENHRR